MSDAERYHPMFDADFDYDRLDPGIRDIVRKLRHLGFDTCDSGDGVSKPAECYASGEAMPFPHVAVSVRPIGGARTADVAGNRLIYEASWLQAVLGLEWDVEGTYWPKTGRIILLATKDAAPTDFVDDVEPVVITLDIAGARRDG